MLRVLFLCPVDPEQCEKVPHLNGLIIDNRIVLMPWTN